jgi:hypothetical protein
MLILFEESQHKAINQRIGGVSFADAVVQKRTQARSPLSPAKMA